MVMTIFPTFLNLYQLLFDTGTHDLDILPTKGNLNHQAPMNILNRSAWCGKKTAGVYTKPTYPAAVGRKLQPCGCSFLPGSARQSEHSVPPLFAVWKNANCDWNSVCFFFATTIAFFACGPSSKMGSAYVMKASVSRTFCAASCRAKCFFYR